MDDEMKKEETTSSTEETASSTVEEPKVEVLGQEEKGFSIASMVLGIISVVLCCIYYISIPCAILALIFGIAGKSKGGKGMAITGIILGIITLALYVSAIVGITTFFTAVTIPIWFF